jgi:hypothetical protein
VCCWYGKKNVETWTMNVMINWLDCVVVMFYLLLGNKWGGV